MLTSEALYKKAVNTERAAAKLETRNISRRKSNADARKLTESLLKSVSHSGS